MTVKENSSEKCCQRANKNQDHEYCHNLTPLNKTISPKRKSNRLNQRQRASKRYGKTAKKIKMSQHSSRA